MSKKMLDCRAAAARALAAIDAGASLSAQIPLLESKVIERDRALFRQLCYGTLRLFPQLTAMAAQLLKKPLKEKDRDVFMLVLLGAYQLLATRVPPHAAVSATVAATRDLKKPWAKALVNGVLRQWQRSGDTLLESLSAAERLAHPQWLFDAISSAWPEHAESIMIENNRPPPMCLRVNQRSISTAQYLQLLTESDIDAKTCDYATEGIRLEKAVGVEKLPLFYQGSVSVQDEAPQLCTQLMSLAPGQRVLDACAAPGGKTCHLLEAEPELAELLALDIDAQRLARVGENLHRLQLKATLLAGDAQDVESWWDGEGFDRILLDAPCSATGVIRRNPDIKLHRKTSDIKKLAKLQGKLLRALWDTLKPGGQLLYATCSLLPQENTEVVAQFCRSTDDAKHIPIEATWGIACEYGRQLFPCEQSHDGFFYALITKNE